MPGDEGGAGNPIVCVRAPEYLPPKGEFVGTQKAEKEGFEPSMEAFTPITP